MRVAFDMRFCTQSRRSANDLISVSETSARDLRSRLVLHFPYRVHYLVRPDEVIIVHIRHTARRPWDTPADVL
jgi:hypothetical protein